MLPGNGMVNKLHPVLLMEVGEHAIPEDDELAEGEEYLELPGPLDWKVGMVADQVPGVLVMWCAEESQVKVTTDASRPI